MATELIGVEPLTYAAWDERSSAAARRLMARGVGRGGRVLLACDTYRTSLCTRRAARPCRYRRALASATSSGYSPRPGALCVIASGAVPAGPASPLWTTVGQLEAGQPVDPLEDVGPQDVAEILYTSGTSGVSKGVVASNV